MPTEKDLLDAELRRSNRMIRDPWINDQQWSRAFQEMFALGQRWNALPEGERLAD